MEAPVRKQHNFQEFYGEVRCANCDCRPMGRWDRGLSCGLEWEISMFSDEMQELIRSYQNEFSYGFDDASDRDPSANRMDMFDEQVQRVAYSAGVIARQRVDNWDEVNGVTLFDIELEIRNFFNSASRDS